MSAADEAREKLEGVTPGPWRTFHDDAEDRLTAETFDAWADEFEVSTREWGRAAST